MRKRTEPQDSQLVKLILRNSLRLFNQDGVQATTTRDIATVTGISPGNLTYHFKKKNDIVNTLTDQLESELTGVIEQIPQISADGEEHSYFLIKQLEVVWKYRFFFNDIQQLIAVDPQKKKRFNQFRVDLIAVSTTAYEQLTINGSVHEVKAPTICKASWRISGSCGLA